MIRPAARRYPVAIIDDHELFSTTLRMALRSEGFDAESVPILGLEAFLARPSTDPAGLVVLDLDLGRDADGHFLSGVTLVADLRRRGWEVLVVSGSLDRPGTAAAIAAGAVGSVPKSSSFVTLLDTVTTAARGDEVMSARVRREWVDLHQHYHARDRELSRRLSRLSRREGEVLEMLAAGMRAAAIAEHFVVSMPTVRSQIRSILVKLEVGSQLEAVALLHQRDGVADAG